MAELKSAHLYRRRGLVERTVALLDREDVVVSFERRALLETRRVRPELRVLQHVGLRRLDPGRGGIRLGRRLLGPARDARGLAKAPALGLATTVYTVNDAGRMRSSRRSASTGSSRIVRIEHGKR